MRLSRLLKHLNISSPIKEEVLFERVSCCHQFVTKNSLFLALKGNVIHGKQYIKHAIKNGACAVLIEDDSLHENEVLLSNEFSVPCIHYAYLKSCLHQIASYAYPGHSSGMKLIGFTGTNGKTSAILQTAQLLRIQKIKSYIISTLGCGQLNQLKDYKITTPDIFTLYEQIHMAYQKGFEVVLVEVSSHAIAQDRIKGLMFFLTVLTSLDYDHIDYHGSFENYLQTKLKLLTQQYTKFRLVNSDIPQIKDWYFEQLSAKNISTFSMNLPNAFSRRFDHHYHMQLKTAVLSPRGINALMHVHVPTQQFDFMTVELKLYGYFNLQAFITASLVLCILGFSYKTIPIDLNEKLTTASGRLQKIDHQNSSLPPVFIDYSHTPDALNNVLRSLRSHFPIASIVLVFGCGGDRDKQKRALMGKCACELAHYIILTNDNPRTEDPKKIVQDIQAGIQNKRPTQVILDRRFAIETALRFAKKSVSEIVVLVAGRGHETHQIFSNKKRYFNDYQVINDVLDTMSD